MKIALLIALIFFTGCSHYVGGECVYEQSYGKAVLKNGFADFYFEQGVWREWSGKKPLYGLNAQKVGAIEEGKVYSAKLSHTTSRACTPASVTLYSMEYLQSAIKNLKITLFASDKVEDKFVNLEELSKLLQVADKSKKIVLHVNLSKEYSQEYRENLQQMYITKIQNALKTIENVEFSYEIQEVKIPKEEVLVSLHVKP